MQYITEEKKITRKVGIPKSYLFSVYSHDKMGSFFEMTCVRLFLTFTSLSIGMQLESDFTLTPVTTDRVDALLLATVTGTQALVDLCKNLKKKKIDKKMDLQS